MINPSMPCVMSSDMENNDRKMIENMKELRRRTAPLEMNPDEFRDLGCQVVNWIADFLASLPDRPVTPGESPEAVQELLGGDSLPMHGVRPDHLLEETSSLLFGHSLFNGHPRFWGYVTSSPAPIGALADLLAAAINPNVGAWALSPMASEIEAQTVRWIAEMIGYPSDCGGILVSGGNMANFIGFLVARRIKANWDVRKVGMTASGEGHRLLVYTSREAHTWIQKASDLFGLGTDSVRWVPTDEHLRLDTTCLRKEIRKDTERGDIPFMVVGTAGTVSTGAVDPLSELAAICREHGLWFHVDGAYGGLAAVLPESSRDLRGLSEADSIAVDPHKWLYTPLEAGCALIRHPIAMRDTFSYQPQYYHFQENAEEILNYYEYGPQNSRGFRALKIWLGLRQVGREGYVRMISDDIQLAQELYRLAEAHPELQAFTQGLSITTFRYVPLDLNPDLENIEEYLNQLNTKLLARLQNSGEAYLSNAVIRGKFVLRACVVNFRTSLEDIEALPHIITRIGAEIDGAIRPEELREKSW